MSESAVAYLSKQKLHVRRSGSTKLIESEFERTVRERTASIERRHAWKTQGRGAAFMGSAWAPQAAKNDVPVLFTGLAGDERGNILYSLETDVVSGVFLLDSGGVETRLFHTADFRIRHTAVDAQGTMLAATAFHPDTMRSNIAVFPVRGTDLSEVTEGDSFDQFPQWASARRIVFQSAGVGRDASGRFAGLGPCTIQTVDLDAGDVEEIAAEEGHDLLQPHQAADGTLYYIRKPYESGVPQASLLGSLKDAALFPVRMTQAIFQYFNIFSMMYTGKPLVTNKGAVQRRIDPRQLFIHGNLANAQMAQAPEGETDALVPSSWVLIRQERGGRSEVVARNVLTFDLGKDGSVLHSDGAAIHRISPDGRSERLLRDEMIDRVVAISLD